MTPSTSSTPAAATPLPPTDSGVPQGSSNGPQTLVGVGVLLSALGLGFGAIGISSEAGYGGVGPNFLPWLVAVVLALCGAWLIWEARSGGFRELETPPGAVQGYWSGFVWVSTGLLLNAALIDTVGFVFSCALCYLLAVQGLRRASGQAAANDVRTWVKDAASGVLRATRIPLSTRPAY